MILKEAIESAKAGNKIRRSGWNDPRAYVVYLYRIDSFVMFHDPIHFTRYIPNVNDTAARDWYIVEDS